MVHKVTREGDDGGVLTKTFLYNNGSTRKWRESFWTRQGEVPSFIVYAYDAIGRVRKVTNPDGTFAENVYGKGSVTYYDELRNARTSVSDAYGRVVEVLEHVDATTTRSTLTTYDVLDHTTTITDAAGNHSSIRWDTLGRKLAQCDVDLGCWFFAYDPAGRMTSSEDAKGQRIDYSYDAIGRMTHKRNPDGQETTWVYDQPGHGPSVGYLTSVDYPGGRGSYDYDSQGRIVSETRCVGSLCNRVQTTHDLAGRTKTITYDDGETVPYGYDAAGRLASVGGYATSLVYDARDQVLSHVAGNGVTTTYTYDSARRWLTSAVVASGPIVLFDSTYGYDDAARVVSSSSTTNAGSNLKYRYDAQHRLIAVEGGQTQSFAYDAIGNMTFNSRVGQYAYEDPAHVHAVTRAGSRAFAYDANGNMTLRDGEALTFDADNRLVAAHGEAMAYDTEGARIRRGDHLYFSRFAEREADGTIIKSYWAGEVLLARRRVGTSQPGLTYYHADRLGSIRVLTDASGAKVATYDYRPFGEVLESIEEPGVVNDTKWGGHRLDAASQLVYMNARYYDPSLARFVSADSMVPDPVNPQALNRYSFGYNNPVSHVDPTGHAPVIAVVIAVVSIAATAPAAIIAVAVVGAVASTAGYVTKNPVLATIGAVALGFATGFVSGAGFLAAPGWGGGIVSAGAALLNSPASPLSPGFREALGWAFNAQALIHAGVEQARASHDAHARGAKPFDDARAEPGTGAGQADASAGRAGKSLEPASASELGIGGGGGGDLVAQLRNPADIGSGPAEALDYHANYNNIREHYQLAADIIRRADKVYDSILFGQKVLVFQAGAQRVIVGPRVDVFGRPQPTIQTFVGGHVRPGVSGSGAWQHYNPQLPYISPPAACRGSSCAVDYR
jgi:RHS repeat-associated protein